MRYCQILLFFFGMLTLVSCEREVTPLPTTGKVTEPLTHLQNLKERREQIKNWALTCDGRPYPGHSYLNEFSEVEGKCAQGDINHWNGISCFAAYLAGDHETENARCRDVANSQESNGRWWRGPTLVGLETRDSFSRDMLNGTMAYFIVKRSESKTKQQARLFKDWVTQNNFQMCLTWSDNRCQITSGAWSTLYQVWVTLGFKEEMMKEAKPLNDSPNAPFVHPDKFIEKMLNNDVSYVTEFLWVNPPAGFEMNLVMVNIILRRFMNLFDPNPYIAKVQTDALDGAAKRLYQQQTGNPFYEFVATGISDHVIERTLELCPGTKPNYAEINALDPKSTEPGGADWAWQRDTAEQVWKKASGHDCIFLINLLIADLKKQT